MCGCLVHGLAQLAVVTLNHRFVPQNLGDNCKRSPRPEPEAAFSEPLGTPGFLDWCWIPAMPRFHMSAALLAALTLIASYDGQVLVASPRAAEPTEKTVPQGTDPPGADNGEQSSPTTQHKVVIEPPKT